MTVVEDRPIMSVKYSLPVPVFYFWRKLYSTLQRGLSAIAEHLVQVCVCVNNTSINLPRIVHHFQDMAYYWSNYTPSTGGAFLTHTRWE